MKYGKCLRYYSLVWGNVRDLIPLLVPPLLFVANKLEKHKTSAPIQFWPTFVRGKMSFWEIAIWNRSLDFAKISNSRSNIFIHMNFFRWISFEDQKMVFGNESHLYTQDSKNVCMKKCQKSLKTHSGFCLRYSKLILPKVKTEEGLFERECKFCLPMGWTFVIPWEEKCFLSAKGRFQQSVFTLFFIQTQQGTEETFSVMHLLDMHIHYPLFRLILKHIH